MYFHLQIDMAKGRAVKLTESTLQLSNLDLITKYFIQGQQSESDSPASKIQTEVISLALSDACVSFCIQVVWETILLLCFFSSSGATCKFKKANPLFKALLLSFKLFEA